MLDQAMESPTPRSSRITSTQTSTSSIPLNSKPRTNPRSRTTDRARRSCSRSTPARTCVTSTFISNRMTCLGPTRTPKTAPPAERPASKLPTAAGSRTITRMMKMATKMTLSRTRRSRKRTRLMMRATKTAETTTTETRKVTQLWMKRTWMMTMTRRILEARMTQGMILGR